MKLKDDCPHKFQIIMTEKNYGLLRPLILASPELGLSRELLIVWESFLPIGLYFQDGRWAGWDEYRNALYKAHIWPPIKIHEMFDLNS